MSYIEGKAHCQLPTGIATSDFMSRKKMYDKSLLILLKFMWMSDECRCLSILISKAQHQKKSLIPHARMDSATKHWLIIHKPDPMNDDRKSKSCGELSENRILEEKKRKKNKRKKEKVPSTFDQ